MSRFAKGGVIPADGNLLSVYVRRVNGRTEYWDSELGRWVAVLTQAEVRASGRKALETLAAPELELADENERNEHG